MQSILITGANGFVGTHLSQYFTASQYDVDTMGRSTQNSISCDITKPFTIDKKYDIVIHCAGLAHAVRSGEKDYFDANVVGTKNLIEAFNKDKYPQNFIFLSTVAVYGVDEGTDISEDHPLDGDTPYAKSKILAEKCLEEWCSTNNIILTIIRPALIAGANPKGNLGAMICGIRTGHYLSIGKANAKKSMVMVSDIANVALKAIDKGGIYNICDDYNPSFKELETLIAQQVGNKRIISIPYFVAQAIALIGDIIGSRCPINSKKLDKITKTLTFSNTKAKTELNWQPLDVLSNFKIK